MKAKILILSILFLCFGCTKQPEKQKVKLDWAIALHGGAGNMLPKTGAARLPGSHNPKPLWFREPFQYLLEEKR